MGVVLAGLLGAAFVLNKAPAITALLNPPPPLVALEAKLERPIVLYVDGTVPEGFRDMLTALDHGTGALASGASPRTLVDLDVYVMVRADWAAFRALDGHDLASVIREQAAQKTDVNGISWFQTTLTPAQGDPRPLLVILANETGLRDVSGFCLALTLYDIARFAGNGPAFLSGAERFSARWKRCREENWTGVEDIETRG